MYSPRFNSPISLLPRARTHAEIWTHSQLLDMEAIIRIQVLFPHPPAEFSLYSQLMWWLAAVPN